MCGIAGFISALNSADATAIARQMAVCLKHRGPDDFGVWVGDGVALAHTRLAIVDLSSSGHQPMESASKRYVLSFNGEIYNHVKIRHTLKGVLWRGKSDTETLLAAIEAWGIEAALSQISGMFAFALWDRRDRRLTLARDRLGEKPLYYGWVGRSFVFASELKALKVHPNWQPNIDPNALSSYMRFGYVPTPHSIYFGINKLPPGAMVCYEAGMVPRTPIAPRQYWSAFEQIGLGDENIGSDESAIDKLDDLLRFSIQRQTMADVPLGAFLSGGIDSSLVTALLQAQTAQPVKTFSIGFLEQAYDEAKHAGKVAQFLGTDHTNFYVTAADALSVIPKLPSMFDEPFGDSSSIPTHLVAELSKAQVTVVMSGDGGDELFGGYNRYFWGQSLWNGMRYVPRGLRALAGRVACSVPPDKWDHLYRYFCKFALKYAYMPNFGDKLHKLAEVIDAESADHLYRLLVSQQREIDSVVLAGREAVTWAGTQASFFRHSGFSERMMFRDLVSYLPDDILTKVDRATMAAGLESRVPLLDPRVVEYSCRLPLHMKIRNGQGKWLLRQVLYRYIPKEIMDRPKQGFGVPLDLWLRGPLRDWGEDLLDSVKLDQQGLLQTKIIRKKWTEHLSGKRNWQHWLWNVLMFQAWHAEQPSGLSLPIEISR